MHTPVSATPVRKHKWWVVLLRAGVTLGALSYLVYSVDWQRLDEVLAHVDLRYIYLPPLAMLLAFLFASFRWSLLLNAFKQKQGVLFSYKYYLIAHFYGLILPGVIGGDAVRITLSARGKGRQLSVVILSIMLERALGMIMILLLGAIALLTLQDEALARLNLPVSQKTISILGIIGLSGVLALFVMMRKLPVGLITPKPSDSKAVATLRNVLEKLQSLPFHIFLLGASLSCLFQFMDIVTTWLLGLTMGIDVSFTVYLVVMPIVYISTVLPISIGGLGVREGVLSLLLNSFGVVLSLAVLLAFAIYLNRLLIGLIGVSLQWIPEADSGRAPSNAPDGR